MARVKRQWRTVVAGYRGAGPAECALCGDPVTAQKAGVRLVDADPPRGPWLMLCMGCVGAGARGAADRARSHAEELPEAERAALLSLAEAVAGIPDERWLTSRDVEWSAVTDDRGYHPVVFPDRDKEPPPEPFTRYREPGARRR